MGVEDTWREPASINFSLLDILHCSIDVNSILDTQLKNILYTAHKVINHKNTFYIPKKNINIFENEVPELFGSVHHVITSDICWMWCFSEERYD